MRRLACGGLLILGLSLAVAGCGKSGSGSGSEKSTLFWSIKRTDGTASQVQWAVTAQWTGEVTEASGSEGAPNFDHSENYSGTTDLDGDWKIDETFVQRQPGKWDLTVSVDGWTHTCRDFVLEKGKSHSLLLTYGNPTCARDTTQFP